MLPLWPAHCGGCAASPRTTAASAAGADLCLRHLMPVAGSAMTQLMLFSSSIPGHTRSELHFVHRRNRDQSLAFPCDEAGRVDMDALDERSRNRYLFARALMGRDFAFPVVAASSQQGAASRIHEVALNAPFQDA